MKQLLIISGLLLSFIVSAVPLQFQADTHYRVLENPLARDQKATKPVIIEFFWYGCPHCYQIEPTLEAWHQKMGNQVDFQRIPAVLGRNWLPHAKAYYVAQQLGVVDTIHPLLMKAIHKDRRSLNSEAALAAFFAEHGVSEEKFRKTYNSFDVENQVRRGMQIARKVGLRGVPAFLVDGQFMVNAGMAGDNQTLFEVIDYLIDQHSVKPTANTEVKTETSATKAAAK